MADRHHGLAQLLGHHPQDLHNLSPPARIQVGGGLVGQHQVRIVGQRPSDGHPLLLPAAQGLWHVMLTPFDPERGEQLVGPRPSDFPGDATRRHHELHVLQGGERFQ